MSLWQRQEVQALPRRQRLNMSPSRPTPHRAPASPTQPKSPTLLAESTPSSSPNGQQPIQEEASTNGPVQHLHRGLADGRPWAEVLLEAIGLWTVLTERRRGRQYNYLLQGEAFDWLLLAERLLEEVSPDLVTWPERERLLFFGLFPASITKGRFQEILGEAKYRAHLNFFYGVIVEEALMHAVEEEVLKERSVRGLDRRGVDDLVMERLYHDNLEVLVRRFCREVGKRYRGTLALNEWKAFVYWLFKLRVALSDQSRLASDTIKGLRQLEAVQNAGALPKRQSPEI